MPLYDYECPCGKVMEHYVPYSDQTLQRCSCGLRVSRRIVSGARLDLFKPQHFDELAESGQPAPYIESRDQLARECRKRGVVSRYLSEGYHQPKGEARWV